jgi:predicted anti-sigma-YlaC factor YlaD
MHCELIREGLDNLWEGEATAEVRQHLAQCAACASYYRDVRLVRAGLRLWKLEDAPEPSLGFAERLVRQLSDLSKAPSMADFFEQVGRRFVYATFVLTCLALLALALPPTGPVRGLTVADIQIASQEAVLPNADPIGETSLQESPEVAPEEVPAPTVTNEVK